MKDVKRNLDKTKLNKKTNLHKIRKASLKKTYQTILSKMSTLSRIKNYIRLKISCFYLFSYSSEATS